MPASESYAAFDIVLVPFPFSDRLADKRRPALVISRPEAQSRHGHVWLAMVTSAGRDRWDSDVPIPDLALAGLPAASVVRTAKVTTTEASRILRRLGRLADGDAETVRRAIVAHLA